MQTKTLMERATKQKEKLTELSKVACGPQQQCGRDSEILKQQFTSSLNWRKGWDKGWGKYGKT